MSADATRHEIDAEVLAWLREPDWGDDEPRFDALALRVFAYQYAYCEPYRLFCDARGATPSKATDRAWASCASPRPIPMRASKQRHNARSSSVATPCARWNRS